MLVYQNEESKTKFMRVSPEDCIVVYKNSSTMRLWKIRLYDIDTEDTSMKTTHYAEVYDATGYDVFTSSEDSTECGGRECKGLKSTFCRVIPYLWAHSYCYALQ